MALLGLDDKKLETVLVQMVAMTNGPARMSFSKRDGNVQGMDELIGAIGADAARLYFVSRKSDSQMSIDLQEVSQKESHNTTFYMQYVHARCASIERRAVQLGIAIPKELHSDTVAALIHPQELGLMVMLQSFNAAIEASANKLAPVILNGYFQELSHKFHSYYSGECKVIVLDDAVITHARLALIGAVKNVFFVGLGLFGATAPEEM
jgi:arginyl-tRNA synthetase